MKVSRRRFLEVGAMSAAMCGISWRGALAASPINLGFQTTTWGAVGMVAEKLKTFEKFDVSVAPHQFDSGVAVRDALVAGRVDIGVTSVSTFIVGVDKGDLKAIATVAYAGASNSIMVAKNSPIKTVPDLRGKKLATQFGAGSDYTLRTKVLAKYGLKDTDVQLVNVKYADQVAALASGSVDAFAGTEPFPAVAEARGLARQLVSFKDFDLVPVMLSIRSSVLEKRRPEVVEFMKGWLVAAEVFHKDPKLAVKIVGDVFRGRGNNLSEKVLATALDRLGVEPDFRPDLVPYLQKQAETLVRARKISKVPNWSEAIDRSILKDAHG